MVCTAEPSGVRRPPWEVLPSRRPIVQRPRADCEDDPEPGTRTSRKKGLAQGAAIRRPHQAPKERLCLPGIFANSQVPGDQLVKRPDRIRRAKVFWGLYL